MLTNNGIALLHGTPGYYSQSSSYYAKITGAYNAFKKTDGTAFTSFSQGGASVSSSYSAPYLSHRLACAAACAYGDAVYSKKLSLPTDAGIKLIITATYDSTNTPISASDYIAAGDDVGSNMGVTVSTTNNHVHTITFDNQNPTYTMHVNRIGIYLYGGTGSSTSGAFIMIHIIAIDDIALNPGKTKSITLTLDM